MTPISLEENVQIDMVGRIDSEEVPIKLSRRDIDMLSEISGFLIRMYEKEKGELFDNELLNSEDPRWIPIHMADAANAIVLEESKYKGYPKNIVMKGVYIEEIDSLNRKWDMLKMKYRK